jgi:ABC-type multidrug transport system fused ATPase/permease subunit
LFFGLSLLPATAGAVLAAVCLAAAIAAAAGITSLLHSGGMLTAEQLLLVSESAAVEGTALSDRGLLPLAARLSASGPQNVVRTVILKTSLLHSNHSALALLIGILCFSLILRWLLNGLMINTVNGHVTGSVRRLRQHLHRQSLRLDSGDLSGTRAAATKRLFQTTAQILEDKAREWGRCLIGGFSDLVVMLLLILLVNWRVGAECLIPVIVCWLVLRLEGTRQAAAQQLLAEQVERGLERLAVGLQKTRIVTGYGMESFEQDQFENNLAQYGQRCSSLGRQRFRSAWGTRLALLCGVALPVYILARHLLSADGIGMGNATVLVLSIGMIFLVLKQLQKLKSLEVEGTLACDEVDQYLKRVPEVGQVVGARFLEPMSRSLLFDQITFESDSHEELLRNLDLRIDSGERVALLSLSRDELNAFVSLIPRLNDPRSGQVLIDGQDIRQATLESLRAEVMIVSSRDALFNATVLENITCGQPDITRQDAIEASKLVHAENFVRQLPHGYEAIIGEHGHRLDVGQAYRLCLARAIARNPALLVIEEPEDVLDSETKAMLDDAYQRICAGRTVLFLPTRLSTVKKCGRIVMLHQGRVAVDGRHEELVRKSELYRHWEYVNFNVFRSEGQRDHHE